MKNIILHLSIFIGCCFMASTGYGQNITRTNHSGPYGAQVNTFTGNLYLERTDLVIPNQGVFIDLTFSYNSYRDTIDLGLGNGWTFAYSMCYYPDSLGLIVEMADGRADLHRKNGAGFEPPTGIFDRLEEYETGKYVLTTKYGMSYFFDDPNHKKLTRIRDLNGNTLTLTYDGAQLSQLSDPSGRTALFEWSDGRLTRITEANGEAAREIRYRYDAQGRLTGVTNPLGDQLSYGYDAQGRLTTLVDENGDALNIAYGRSGAVYEMGSCFSSLKFNYNSEQRKTYVIESNQGGDRITTYVYDEEGRLLQKYGNCCGFNTSYNYDSDNNINLVVDANGNSFQSNHDNRGNAARMTDPAGAAQQYQYAGPYNRLTGLKDKRGAETQLTYDDRGNLTRIQQPLGISSQLQYDDRGNVVQATDGLGQTTRMAYNANNDLTRVDFPIGSESYTYDGLGRLRTSTDANGHTLRYEYDALDRLTAMTDPLGNRIAYTFDAASNLTGETDANGHTRRYDYDAHYRLERVTTPTGTTVYGYDSQDNLVSITDANDHVTTFTYDKRNLLTAETDALGHTTTYDYDANGNVIARHDANGATTLYAYDALNRLIAKSYEGNADTYEYDANGNLVRAANKDISLRFTYDALNRLVSKTVENWGKTIRYTYDANGNRLTMTDPDGGLTRYAYDANNRLISLANPQNETTGFAYDPAGRLTRQDNANGTYTLYDYDAADRLLKIEHRRSDGQVFSSFAYTYDANGNRLTKTDQDGGVEQYAYDGDNRLTRVVYANGDIEIYTYDGKGNRLRLERNGTATDYAYDAADRIQSAGDIHYDFDANGNMIQKTDGDAITRYRYDGENRLIEAVLPGEKSVGYAYDPFGIRISRTGTDGSVVRYFHDGDNVLMELSDSGDILVRYTSGTSIDKWISMDRNGESSYYHADGLGSIMKLTASDQSIRQEYKYRVYGTLLQEQGMITNSIRFTGREWEEKLGFYYSRIRLYDPKTANFTRKDILFGNIFVPLSQNRYSYTENNPIKFVDPYGLNKTTCNDGGITQAIFLEGRIPSWLRKAVGYITGYEIIGQGVGLGFAVSHPGIFSSGGRWDLGILLQLSAGEDISYGLGKAAVSYQNEIGSLRDFFGSSTSVYAHYKLVGGGVSLDENNNVSGLKLSFGPGLLLGGGMDFTGGWSLRDGFFRPGAAEEQKCKGRGAQDDNGKGLIGSIIEIIIEIIQAIDPNEIAGPPGVGPEKWVGVEQELPYTIFFENDPDFATAPAQRVTITHEFDEDLNPFAFRLGDFGFGDYVFEVPADVSFYRNRIDLSDTLGLYLDVIAGLDIERNRAFWTFESIDPATGLPSTLAAERGFLPVNDTTLANGEGFVRFTVRPDIDAPTNALIEAMASIVFDDNAPIQTNLALNTIDADRPQSNILQIAASADSARYELSWSGSDVGAGLGAYDLYVSTNGGPFLPRETALTGDRFTFYGSPDSVYQFFTRSVDRVDNLELLKNFSEPACMSAEVLALNNEVNGQANGLIEIAVSGAQGPPTYRWSHAPDLNEPRAENLPGGNYQIVVSDTAGCTIALQLALQNEIGTSTEEIRPRPDLWIANLYPVPATSELNVIFYADGPEAEVAVYALNGRLLQRRKVAIAPREEQELSLNVGNLPAGPYLLQLSLPDGRRVNGLFVKQ